MVDSEKEILRGWLALADGTGEKAIEESPRLAAMQRLKEKRAAARVRADSEADAGAEWSGEAQRQSKSIKIEEASSLTAHSPPPPVAVSALAPPPPPPAALRPVQTTTLQVFPGAPLPPPPQDGCVTISIRSLAKRGVGVTRVDGQKVTGSLRRFDKADEIVICCDCHNKMFSPEGFVNHAGMKGLSEDNPLKHIWILKE
ncbi:hypothetical protein QQ045_013602 [Rhodiola kirilowii]